MARDMPDDELPALPGGRYAYPPPCALPRRECTGVRAGVTEGVDKGVWE